MGILGPFTGKVGTVVGYVWRGRQVVRAYRRHINYPNTASQQHERQWFVSMVRFAASARQALLLGLRERAAREQMTEGNAFVKMNKRCFSLTPTPEGSGLRIDYERIVISEGPAVPVRFTAAAIDDKGILHVDFEKHSAHRRAKGTDRVYVYAYNMDTREGLLSHPADRRAGHLALQLPDGWNAQNVKLWGFTIDPEGRASGTIYIEPGGEGCYKEPETEKPATPRSVEKVLLSSKDLDFHGAEVGYRIVEADGEGLAHGDLEGAVEVELLV